VEAKNKDAISLRYAVEIRAEGGSVEGEFALPPTDGKKVEYY